MQIIRKDNYDREGPGYDEVLIYRSPRLDSWLGTAITSILNYCEAAGSANYYCTVDMDYKLRKFEP